MATNAKKGNKFVLKLASTANGSTYTQVAALRSTQLVINNTMVDTSNKDTDGWQESLAGGGLKSMAITASGIYSDGAGQDLLHQAVFGNVHWNAQVTDEDGATYTGAFHVESLTLAGEANDVQTFEISMASSGEVTYTPAA